MAKQSKSKTRPSVLRWGYIGPTGNVVIPIQYEKAEPFAGGLGVVTLDGLQGYMDRQGKWVLRPRFEGLGPLEDGLAYAIQGGKWGQIDQTGNFVYPPTYDYFGPFCDGLARVKVDGRYGYVDRSGKSIIAPRYSIAADFRHGLALVTDLENDLPKSFIDQTGRVAYGPYRAAESFSEGWAGVWDGKRCSFINSDGQTVLELPLGVIANHFDEGLASAHDQTSASNDEWLFGFIDRQGRWAIRPQFDLACLFQNGCALVEIDDKKGLIDKAGCYVVPLGRFDYVEGLRENRILFWKEKRGGYFDECGRVVIEPQYRLAQWFSEGLAPVCLEQTSVRS